MSVDTCTECLEGCLPFCRDVFFGLERKRMHRSKIPREMDSLFLYSSFSKFSQTDIYGFSRYSSDPSSKFTHIFVNLQVTSFETSHRIVFFSRDCAKKRFERNIEEEWTDCKRNFVPNVVPFLRLHDIAISIRFLKMLVQRFVNYTHEYLLLYK